LKKKGERNGGGGGGARGGKRYRTWQEITLRTKRRKGKGEGKKKEKEKEKEKGPVLLASNAVSLSKPVEVAPHVRFVVPILCRTVIHLPWHPVFVRESNWKDVDESAPEEESIRTRK